MRVRSCIALVAVALLTACASSTQGSRPPTPTPRSGIASAIAREAASPDPNFDMGYRIQITDKGFHPYVLVAPCCQAITWTNRTSGTISVVFTGVDSGPIAPGGTFTFKPAHIEAIAYHSGQDPTKQGRIQVQQTMES